MFVVVNNLRDILKDLDVEMGMDVFDDFKGYDWFFCMISYIDMYL